MLTCPNWIEPSDQERRSIRFIWDDSRTLHDFTGDPTAVLRAAMKMSLRARMVLCMGLYEWIVWRFDDLHDRVEPLQIAEAGWCASVDPRYMRFFELTRGEWVGPIYGPLWCAATWLQPAMSKGHLFPKGVYDALSFLTRLGLHVLPEIDEFENWLALTLDRLIQLHPLLPEDPFEDLFEHKVGQRLGPLIGRNVLDPQSELDAAKSMGFLEQNLRIAAHTGNPFLSTLDDLEEIGFVDSPYVLPN